MALSDLDMAVRAEEHRALAFQAAEMLCDQPSAQHVVAADDAIVGVLKMRAANHKWHAGLGQRADFSVMSALPHENDAVDHLVRQKVLETACLIQDRRWVGKEGVR